jgi:hypothetical protein
MRRQVFFENFHPENCDCGEHEGQVAHTIFVEDLGRDMALFVTVHERKAYLMVIGPAKKKLHEAKAAISLEDLNKIGEDAVQRWQEHILAAIPTATDS